jgi:hypothetical protein
MSEENKVVLIDLKDRVVLVMRAGLELVGMVMVEKIA